MALQEAYALVREQCQAEHRRQKELHVRRKSQWEAIQLVQANRCGCTVQPFLVVDPESCITLGKDLLRSWNDWVRPRIKSQAFMDLTLSSDLKITIDA